MPETQNHRCHGLWRKTNHIPSRRKTPPTINPNFRRSRGPVLRCLNSSPMTDILVKLELLQPIDVFIERLLFLFLEEEISHDQIIHVRAHEAKIGVLGSANDR